MSKMLPVILLLSIGLLACSKTENPRFNEGQTTTQLPRPSPPPAIPDSIKARIALSITDSLAPEIKVATAEIETLLSTSPNTHPLNLKTLGWDFWDRDRERAGAVRYARQRDPYDREFEGDRISNAEGLYYVEREHLTALKGFWRLCDSKATAHLPKYPKAGRPTAVEVCNIYGNLYGTKPMINRIDDYFLRRRLSEIEKLHEYLRTRIGKLSGNLEPDKERAIMYLARLAQRVEERDGVRGSIAVTNARRASEWRDKQIEAGRITREMSEELAWRGVIESYQVEHRRNLKISDQIARQKLSRTPAERREAWQAVCDAAFGSDLVSRQSWERGCR